MALRSTEMYGSSLVDPMGRLNTATARTIFDEFDRWVNMVGGREAAVNVPLNVPGEAVSLGSGKTPPLPNTLSPLRLPTPLTHPHQGRQQRDRLHRGPGSADGSAAGW